MASKKKVKGKMPPQSFRKYFHSDGKTALKILRLPFSVLS